MNNEGCYGCLNLDKLLRFTHEEWNEPTLIIYFLNIGYKSIIPKHNDPMMIRDIIANPDVGRVFVD